MTPEKQDQSKKTSDIKRLYRSKVDRIFAGICGGFAEYFNVDVTIVRIIWLVLAFFQGIGIVLYLVCLFVMKENPEQSVADQKKPQNTGIYWGIGLILLGISLLSPHWRWSFPPYFPFRWYLFEPWFFNWDKFWPVVIILLGIVYLIYVLRQKKEPTNESQISLYRSRDEKIIGGVCGGLAKKLNVDPVIIRIGWVVLSLITKVLLGVIVYILWMIIVPEEKLASGTTTAPSEQKSPPPKKTPKRVKSAPKDENTEKQNS